MADPYISGGTYNASLDLLAGFKGLLRGETGEGTRNKGKGRKERGERRGGRRGQGWEDRGEKESGLCNGNFQLFLALGT